jgi:hypothetical protein
MRLLIVATLLTVTALAGGAVRAQGTNAGSASQEVEDVEAVAPDDVPCVIDEQLSLWLALESVDRTIAALEGERRELAKELGTTLKALDVLDRADDSDDVEMADLGTLVQAKAAGRDAITDAYVEIENRLVDIEKTLERRRGQRSMLEAELERRDAPTGE